MNRICWKRRPRRATAGRASYACFVVPLMTTAVWALDANEDPPKGERGTRAAHSPEDGPGRDGFQARRRGPARGGKGYWNRMSEAEKEKVQTFMEEHFPQMYLEMQRLRERSPERFDRRIRWVVHDIQEMMDLMEIQPGRAALMIQERKLMFQMRRTARQYHRAENSNGKDKTKERFRDLCAQAFDCRHQRREMEISELEARVAELKLRHAEAAKIRDKLIDQEVEDHLSRTHGGPPRGRGHRFDGPPGRGPKP